MGSLQKATDKTSASAAACDQPRHGDKEGKAFVDPRSVSSNSPLPAFNEHSHYEQSAKRNTDLEDIYRRWDNMVPEDQKHKFRDLILIMIAAEPKTQLEFNQLINKNRKQLKFLSSPRKSEILFVYREMQENGEIPKDHHKLNQYLIKKAGKSHSGVLVITVLTSPYPKVGNKTQKFSCEWNCYYCPNEPGQPRSYLHDEPGVIRANRNNFDTVLQFHDRAATLAANGHPIDKIELLVLGGTWSSYPLEYQETFIRDLFYAANTLQFRAKKNKRAPLPLAEEQKLNETAMSKIIGITLETRPDCITPDEIRRYRRYGCTRVQIGIQHTDDEILKLINRGCTNADTIAAIRLMLDCCYKIDGHFMPDLPGSNPEKDWKMFQYVLDSPDVRVDQMKLYPHAVVPWTVTKKWLDEGRFKPYSLDSLVSLLVKFKTKVHPWIRLNRVIRDIPSHYVSGDEYCPNLRQLILAQMKKQNLACRCIRCREIKLRATNLNKAKLLVRRYEAAGGMEYFVSFESEDEATICSFLRLRLSKTAGAGVFPELKGAALIRELHVYGKLIATKDHDSQHAQNVGLGRRLLQRAEQMAVQHGYGKVAVISGIGVRGYYRKQGYELESVNGYMTKDLRSFYFYYYRAKLFFARNPLYLSAILLTIALAISIYGNMTS